MELFIMVDFLLENSEFISLPLFCNHKTYAAKYALGTIAPDCCAGTQTHNLGNPVALKGDLSWYSFRRTSAFSAPS